MMKLVAMPPLRGGVLNDVRVQVSLLVKEYPVKESSKHRIKKNIKYSLTTPGSDLFRIQESWINK